MHWVSRLTASGMVVLIAAVTIGGGGSAPSSSGSPAPAKDANSAKTPGDNLEYWLGQAQTAPGPSATRPAATEPAKSSGAFWRKDALPGVIELSGGQVLAGWMYTTIEKNWEVFIDPEKRWRLVPFVTALSITAIVEEEVMEKKWRWKEMGVPERVYTGEEFPTRRLSWKIHLIDDTFITGPVKGQPLWIEYEGRKSGPFILAERSKGEVGQKLSDLVYVKRIIVSRRLMDAVLRDQARTGK